MTDGPSRASDAYRSETPTHNGYGMPRGPVGTIPENAPPVAIGFCPMCGANARKTCSTRGAFDCPQCDFSWYDDRVGEQTYSLEDFVTTPDTEQPADQHNDTTTETP